MTNKNHIAIVYPAGTIRTEKEEREKRILEFKNLGFEVTNLFPKLPSTDNCTSSPVLERATQLSYALTMRKFSVLFADRGGVGTTELVPYLENLLPPVISDKILVGFSDISFLGNYLALRFPNLTYIHGQNFFAKNLFSGQKLDEKVLFDTLAGKKQSFTFPTKITYPEIYNQFTPVIKGKCIPINLSLAESLSSLSFLKLPENNILFLEDCNEYVYRIIRKIDSLINSNIMKNTKAIVLGSFNGCLDTNEQPVSREFLIKLFAKKTGLPVVDLPIFGHEEFRFPLVANSEIIIEAEPKPQIKITNYFEKTTCIATQFSPILFNQSKEKNKVHCTGIGGTGMAQVAGFFVEDGYKVTGSDNPIYPPMDKIIADLNIVPDVGFLAENIKKNSSDFIILANVVSRLSASLKQNDELEEILNQNIPVVSFPSALRKYFLHASRNIIISGTHGKTTTSSLVAYLLNQLDYNPSFLIGGSPVNFKAGFALNSRKLFVLEGDEYDSAFFDKGPKFLHYEPKISLINNIEFDHADIYENVQAIEDEFLKLAQLTQDRDGFVVVNLDDSRVAKIAQQVQENGGKIIGFAKNNSQTVDFPVWKLKGFQTTASGIEITGITPKNKTFTFKTKIFGEHNALNCIASFAILHANEILDGTEDKTEEYLFLNKAARSMEDFKGVKRRFELLAEKNNISVFDDFAHHPTAITTTIQAFRDYTRQAAKTGRLIICFDPRNATMRRNILQQDLIKSFAQCDILYLGKVPQDLRMNPEDILDGTAVARACGEKATYFDDNERLLQTLKNNVQHGDTVVFMSSGSFDSIPDKFADTIKNM
ncbi:MAG: Mur ligase family protein [Bdellovibrionota bacterium]